jgi:hypothetical protein
LVGFSAHSNFGVRLFFISSVSAVAIWPTLTGSEKDAPEDVLQDWRVPEAMGYGQSKLLPNAYLTWQSER